MRRRSRGCTNGTAVEEIDVVSESLTSGRCTSMTVHDDEIQKDQFLAPEAATKQILASEYAVSDIGVDPSDPLGFKGGEEVDVEMTDATPGYYPQAGRLIGLSSSRIVVQVENGLRIHFPRVGYVAKRRDGANGVSGNS